MRLFLHNVQRMANRSNISWIVASEERGIFYQKWVVTRSRKWNRSLILYYVIIMSLQTYLYILLTFRQRDRVTRLGHLDIYLCRYVECYTHLCACCVCVRTIYIIFTIFVLPSSILSEILSRMQHHNPLLVLIHHRLPCNAAVSKSLLISVLHTSALTIRPLSESAIRATEESMSCVINITKSLDTSMLTTNMDVVNRIAAAWRSDMDWAPS